jgi:hypothetical protein
MRVSFTGAIAAQMLSATRGGRIAAVSQHSFYLESGGDFACIGAASIGRGPLNIIVERSDLLASAARTIRTGVQFGVEGHSIELGCGHRIAFGGARIWRPPEWLRFSRAHARRWLETLTAEAPCPQVGLAPLVLKQTGGDKSIARIASGPIGRLAAGLAADAVAGRIADKTACAARQLIGLGPGLTPSGDDMLAGIMLALAATRHHRLRDQLWTRIEPNVAALTSSLSGAHLRAAAEGMTFEAVHLALNDMLSGCLESMPVRLAGLDRVGHCSGWDMLAGAALIVQCLSSLSKYDMTADANDGYAAPSGRSPNT